MLAVSSRGALQTGCLTLFSTHYHMLMEEYKNDKLISMYHMVRKQDSPLSRLRASTSWWWVLSWGFAYCCCCAGCQGHRGPEGRDVYVSVY